MKRILSYLLAFALLATGISPNIARADEPVAGMLLYSSFDKNFDADQSGGIGRATPGGNPRLTDGVSGTAVLIGKDAYLQYSTRNNISAKAGTIAFWAKPVGWNGNDNQFHYLVSMDGESDWMIAQTVDSSVAFMGGSRKNFSRSGTSVADWQDGEWRYFVFTWTDANHQIYMDGKPAMQPGAWPVAPADLGERLLLGGQLFGASEGQTAIDEFTVYDHSLTAEQIAGLYAQAVAKSPALKKEIAAAPQNILADNLIRPGLGAIVLPSSQTTSPDDAVEHVMDGNFDTKWVSAPGTFPNWIEVRWPQPVSVSRLLVDEYRQTQTKSFRVEAFKGNAWSTIVAPTENRAPAGQRLEIGFAPVETTRLRFVMLASSGGANASSFVTELQAIGSSDQSAALSFMARPWWKSQWIWFPEGAVSGVVRYFRRHFSIDDIQKIHDSWLQIGADDNFEVFVNGQLVGKGEIETKLFNIKNFLRTGDNVIAVKAQEYDIFEGVIAEITLNRSDGKVERIVSDRTWKAWNGPSENWFAPDVNESDWKASKEQGQPPFSPHHGEQNYFNVGEKAAFQVRALKSTPLEGATVKPGSKVRLDFEVVAPSAVENDYGFELRIGDKPSLGADFSIAAKSFLPQSATTGWKAGQAQAVSVEVWLPDWAPHGEVPVALTPLGKGVEGRIVDAAQKDVADNVVGTLRIQRFANTPKPWPAVAPRSEIKMDNGRPTLFINGKKTTPFIQTHDGGMTYRAIGEYAQSGVHLWRVYANKGINSPAIPDDRIREREEYFKVVDRCITNMLKVDPDAYIIFLTQIRGTKEWTDRNPDDATILADGRRIGFSISSRRWLQETREDMAALVKHMMAQEYAGHVIGIHFDLIGETYYHGYNVNPPDTKRQDLIIGDFSPEHIRAFRIWLRARYQTEAALQAAWKDSKVGFETAYPDLKVLQREDLMSFRDPAKTRLPFDYWEFHSEAMADRVNDIARTIKEASGGKYITGFWGLYSNGFNAATGAPGKVQHVAYAALQKVLKSPYVDYIGLLQAYAHTRWGTPMVPISLAQSIRASGKMCLIEYDMRTFFTPLQFTERTYSERETQAVLHRDVAAAATHGDALWWVGFAEGSTNRASIPWYDDVGIQKTLIAGRKAYNAAYGEDSNSNAEVAVFMNNADAYALDALTAHNVLQSAQYNVAYFELPKLGAPHDEFELEDIALPGMDRYKVYVFLNAFNVSETQRERIKSIVRQKGKTAVWLYAPGFNDGEKLSLESIRDLTGMKIGYDQKSATGALKIENNSPWTRGLPANYELRAMRYAANTGPFELGPNFFVDDPDTQVLGHYVADGKTAMAARKIGEAQSIYVGVPFIDAATLRGICLAAGVHLYTPEGVWMDASKSFITVTATEKGFRQNVALPRAATVFDVWNRRVVAQNATSFTPDIAPMTTGWYFWGTPQQVEEFRKRLESEK